ncbi:serine hydrolase domain-containing protein [Mesorhizobium sp. M6A.T.Ce.TU.016.01.1.1]|uniref:serine hydrolase domain-containing protein n=1 Tax=Mesorhizobium sp. M6A.T.Ce.TU.016.01.1.1 TaxID=2496783 RepID=UPI000FCA063F|nr:serine hydrolase domain-containing protein [Mesorhizobium sp. M6A.T.Ce.TU.016.01.1.1]RUU29776.1 class A beta-lactamase-related serine hydrolase [Mesorhizobium sp. M6A.T.Ce.TU.016.01.1.1]
MTRRQRFVLIASAIGSVALAFFTVKPIASEALFWRERRTPADVVAYFMRQENIDGAVFAYGPAGQSPVRKAGFGNLKIDATLPIASLSKTITAAAVFELADAGLVDLDASLAKYFPDELAGAKDDRYRLITPRMLLQHTSGLDHAVSFKRDTGDDCWLIAKEELATPLHFAPGTKWEYANLNYCWLGLLIARVSGQRYDDYASQKVLAGIEGFSLSDRTKGAAYGWSATAEGLFQFASSARPLPPKAPAPSFYTGINYGYGWFLEPAVAWHLGSMPGSLSLAIKADDGWTMVVIFNKRPAGARKKALHLKQMLIRAHEQQLRPTDSHRRGDPVAVDHREDSRVFR